MTIQSETRKAGPFTGNGSTTAFPFEFKVFAASDLYVVRATDGGIETVLDQDAGDYSVSLNADQEASPGGTVTLPSALPQDYTLTITSAVSNTQTMDLTNQGGFYPEVINRALDRTVVQVQQLAERVDRSLKVPLSTPTAVSAELPLPEADKILGWNEEGTALQNVDAATLASLVAYGQAQADIFDGDGTTTQFTLTNSPVSQANLDVAIGGVVQLPGTDYTWSGGTTLTFTSAPPAGAKILARYLQGLPVGDPANGSVGGAKLGKGAVVELGTIAQLKAYAGVVDVAVVRGYHSAGDGGGGVFFWDSSSSETDDGGMVVASNAGGNGRWKRILPTATLHVAMFGAKGDGAADDGVAIQSAINALSAAGGGFLFFTKGATYITTPITPKSGAYLMLNGATLKLKASSNWLLIDGTGASGSHFGIYGGTLDPNKAENNSNVNQCGGGVWLAGWKNVELHNVKIQNAFRASVILNNCSYVSLENIEQIDCGDSTNAYGLYGYGLEIVNGSHHITINNFTVSNHYGFGIHFWDCSNIDATDLTFSNLTFGGQAIAITWTQAYRVHCRNIACDLVDGDNLECNASFNCTMDGVRITNAGDLPIVMGDNGSGISNEFISWRNVYTSGTVGTLSLRLSYVKNCKFENFSFDKGMDTLSGVTSDTRNAFIDGSFGVNLPEHIHRYRKFRLERVTFSNVYVQALDKSRALFASPSTYDVAIGAAVQIEFDEIFGASIAPDGMICGDLVVQTQGYGGASQATRHRVPFIVTADGVVNLGVAEKVSSASAREVAIAGDGPNRRITLTNSIAGADLYLNWSIQADLIF